MSTPLLSVRRVRGNHTARGPGLAVCALPLAISLALCVAGPARAASRRTPVVDVVDRVRSAVVNIHSERTARGPATEELFALAPSQNRINGMGTGVLVDPRGYIVTNEHVVEDVNIIRVRLSDGTTYTARVLARDQETDLALLKVESDRPLPTMPLGTVKDLMVGETVVAIGNAYGYEHTVTVGVVSALKRDVTLNKEVSYKSLIQTDASINPGNSGGPLLNINGEMVGVNVAIRAGAQGISFAIPVDTMIRVVAEMMSVRRHNGTWHGLVCTNRVEPVNGASEGTTRSLVVDRLAASGPGAHAGLQAGDVLVRVGDLQVSNSLDLERALLDHAAGEGVPVTFRRQGAEQRCELVLQSADQLAPSNADLVWRKLGLRLSPVNNEVVSRTNSQLQGGLAVAEINPDGVAAKAGIQRGDILVGLHTWKTQTLDNVAFVLTHRDLASFNPLTFYIIRSGQVHRGWLPQVD
ncbi:MAG TPA: trypsin-like peptidase domain-containing protein [Gemmataceae bacterium]|jgi:serine protease Do|nr:trypsin-like peptidase domain-containing protein [Gemmataceae bacterium]